MNVMAGLTGMPWMAELTEVPEITENDQKKVDKKRGYENSGQIVLKDVSIEQVHSVPHIMSNSW